MGLPPPPAGPTVTITFPWAFHLGLRRRRQVAEDLVADRPFGAAHPVAGDELAEQGGCGLVPVPGIHDFRLRGKVRALSRGCGSFTQDGEKSGREGFDVADRDRLDGRAGIAGCKPEEPELNAGQIRRTGQAGRAGRVVGRRGQAGGARAADRRIGWDRFPEAAAASPWASLSPASLPAEAGVEEDRPWNGPLSRNTWISPARLRRSCAVQAKTTVPEPPPGW